MRNEQPNARDTEVAVVVRESAQKKWEKVREFAPGTPGAAEGTHAHAPTRVIAPKRLIAEPGA
ncbi:hypothetical protein ACWD4G_05605 [Streptomyces sp. NPDC002643]